MPSTTADNGRDEHGHFIAGNHAAKGNPFARRVAALRSALLDAITPDDIRAICTKLIEQARAGDIAAARTLFDRTLGRPLEADILARIEALEEEIEVIT
jgi:hypothetical protein